jgi:hypothetical protein
MITTLKVNETCGMYNLSIQIQGSTVENIQIDYIVVIEGSPFTITFNELAKSPGI